MTRRRYDPNPDVDELLHYSGAGAATLARVRAENDARLWAASRETSVHAQRKERRENVIDAAVVLGVVVALFVIVWCLTP
jgi:hypothetical protein